jgi:hypothetical protein
MTIYARIDPDTQVPQARDFGETVPPATKGWLPLVIDAQPTPGVNQVVVSAGIVFEATQARQTWALREKTADELEVEALTLELAQAANIIANLETQNAITNPQFNALTTAQKFDVLRADRNHGLRALLFLMRRAKRGM